MAPVSTPYKPYADVHAGTKGPGDARPTAAQVIKDCGLDADGLRGKTVLITGCSSGTGLESARALYEAGADVFITARNMAKLNKVVADITATSAHKGKAPRLEPIELHLDNLESVRAAAKSFREQSEKLDILINNAGVMAIPFSRSVDGFESHMATNHFGHFLLTALLLPLLTASGHGRIINVSSSGHVVGPLRLHDLNYTKEPEAYEKSFAYGQSKLANVYHANALSRHYASKGIVAFSLHPGYVESELGRHLADGDLEAIAGDMTQLEKEKKSTTQGAATQVWAAVSKHFDDVKDGGRYLADVGEAGPWEDGMSLAGSGYAPFAYDEKAEEELWKISCEAVGVEI